MNISSPAKLRYATFYLVHLSLFSLPVVKPTEVPTEPPTPPAPATVPPALDGEESVDICIKVLKIQ